MPSTQQSTKPLDAVPTSATLAGIIFSIPINIHWQNNSAANSASAQRVRTKYAQNIQHFVVTKIRAAHNNSKKRYDLRARSRAFAVGDIVWRRSFELSNAAEHRTKKLGPKFIPCIVRQVQGSNNYMLDDIKTSKTGVYHSKDIKAD